MGGPCDYCVSPSPFGLDFGTLDFGTSDLDLTKKEEKGHMKPFLSYALELFRMLSYVSWTSIKA